MSDAPSRVKRFGAAKIQNQNRGASPTQMFRQRRETDVAWLSEDGVPFPREVAELEMVVRQRPGEEQFEIAVFARRHHVLATDQGDDVVLFQKRFIGADAG